MHVHPHGKMSDCDISSKCNSTLRHSKLSKKGFFRVLLSDLCCPEFQRAQNQSKKDAHACKKANYGSRYCTACQINCAEPITAVRKRKSARGTENNSGQTVQQCTPHMTFKYFQHWPCKEKIYMSQSANALVIGGCHCREKKGDVQ